METLQMLVFAGAWLLFLVAVGYGFGIGGARRSGWAAPGQKLPGYVEVRSLRLARLLVSRYSRSNGKIDVSIIGLRPNRFWLNGRPRCVSRFGIFDWCVTLPLTAWWAWEVTRFFWLTPLLEPGLGGLPAAGLTLGLYRGVMRLVGAWNNSKADLGPALTREELRAALKKKEETP